MTEPTSPPAPSKPGRIPYAARVERIFDHNDDTRSLFLRIAGVKPLRFVPGQFISISIPLPDETRTRAYSIASNPGDELAELCFNRVAGGRGVAWLFERTVGDELGFTGPFGTFTMDRPPDAETVFIAENTAIAPIRPMLHRAAPAGHPPALLLYAASNRERILYRQELEDLAIRHSNFRFETMIVSHSIADLWTALHDEVERRWVKADDNRTRHFYICGVGKGVVRLRDLLRGAGYERRSVHYEQW